MKNICCRALAAAVALCVLACGYAGEGRRPVGEILCTTYPASLFVRNIARGVPGVRVESLFPAELGCPHDYALTPRDMAGIARADVLVVNGLGMEDFLGKPVELANPAIAVIDGSRGVDGVIMDGQVPNPHLFTSPTLAARMAETIAARLCDLDPANATAYSANARRYAGDLRALAREMADEAGGFANRRIVDPHGAFGYLARDLGLEIVADFQPRGQALSAAGMLTALAAIREEKPGGIVVEPRYPAETGETLAAETGCPLIRLDPVATGPEKAPLDHYQAVMRANLEQLKKALGGQ